MEVADLLTGAKHALNAECPVDRSDSARQLIGLLKIKIAIGFRVRHAQTRRSDYGRLILESNARRV